MDVSPPAQVNGETRSIFAIREAFHPTARPKHKMHIRFSGPQTDGPPLDRRTLYRRRTASAYGAQTFGRRGALCGQKTSRLPRRSDQQRPRSRPLRREQARRNRPPARTASGTPSFYTERRGFVNTLDKGFPFPNAGKAQGRPHLVRFLRHMHWIPARGRSESHAPRVGMRRSPPLVPAWGSERERAKKPSPLPALPEDRHDGAGGSFLLRAQTRPSARRRADKSSRPAGRQRARPSASSSHIIADLANVLHSRFSSC